MGRSGDEALGALARQTEQTGEPISRLAGGRLVVVSPVQTHKGDFYALVVTFDARPMTAWIWRMHVGMAVAFGSVLMVGVGLAHSSGWQGRMILPCFIPRDSTSVGRSPMATKCKGPAESLHAAGALPAAGRYARPSSPSGSQILNSVPCPISLLTEMSPECILTTP